MILQVIFQPVSGALHSVRNRVDFLVQLAGAQLQAEFDAVFRIRYRAGFDAEARIVWRGQRFDLAGAPMIVNARERSLDLFCTSGVRDGR